MALEFIGHLMLFIFGVGIGAGIMYGFEVFMDWKEDREERT